MPIIKDLILDMTDFYDKYKAVKPYLINTDPVSEDSERLQSNEDAEKLFESTKCILCACCTTSCPSTWTNSNYIGPAALLKAYRFVLIQEMKPLMKGLILLIHLMVSGDATQFSTVLKHVQKKLILHGIFHSLNRNSQAERVNSCYDYTIFYPKIRKEDLKVKCFRILQRGNSVIIYLCLNFPPAG